MPATTRSTSSSYRKCFVTLFFLVLTAIVFASLLNIQNISSAINPRIKHADPAPAEVIFKMFDDFAPENTNERKLNKSELTKELTRRQQQSSENRKIVYKWPCNEDSNNVSACVGSCAHPLNYKPKEIIEKMTSSSQLSLSSEQRETVSSLGEGIPKSDVIIASAVSSNHFDEMQAMFENLHRVVYPALHERIKQSNHNTDREFVAPNKVAIHNFTVVVYDIGLSADQRELMEKRCRCKVITFNKDLFPTHVKDNHCYSWKPLLLLAASQHASKLIVWQDSSVRWLNNFLNILDATYNSGHNVLRHLTSRRVTANTLKETFDYLVEDPCSYLPYPEIQGNIHIHKAGAFLTQTVFEPWAKCALEKMCICPQPPMSVLSCSKGAIHSCHRFDQSALTIILSRLYQKELWKFQIQDFEFNKGTDIKVLRGSTNKNYFNSL